HPECLQIPDGEVPAAEQLELEHRLLCAALVEEKRCEREHAAEQRHQDRGTRPPVARLLDQPEDEAAQSRCAQDGSRKVDRAVAVTSAPAAPCAARAAISQSIDGAAAHATESAPNATTPIANTRRAP